MAGVIAGIENAGGSAVQDPRTEILTVNGEFTVSVVLSRCFETAAGSLRWRIRLDTLHGELMRWMPPPDGILCA